MVELQRETALDPVMVNLAAVILHGWPESERNVPKELKPYFNVRDQLPTRDGVMYKGEKVVVPKSTQSDYLSRIDLGHTAVADPG